jgi:SAM-dependent methyltransferase
MDAVASKLFSGGSCRGMLQIVRYNWSMYAGAGFVLGAVMLALLVFDWPPLVRWIGAAVLICGAFWYTGSLIVSHYVYDRSPLSEWRWLAHAFASPPLRWVHIHAGFDETRGLLAEIFPRANGTALDVYHPGKMTEPSIRRARKLSPAVAVPSRLDALPLREESCDAVFLIFAAHEIRNRRARECFFAELSRVLQPGGRVLLVEHLRDVPNFLAFGPGFLHFLARREWLRLGARAGFKPTLERSVTPFVRCLVMEKMQ